ncbi:ATP-dependent helicase [Desulfococcus multivorans]|jgi:ATP-dependent helicase HrpA|uniref:ATP-dependent helicase HrpA n=2 Tax=Desulfococcaceae TaxID=2931039 RepID=S7TZB1_DESML|nr:ATP-dependent RNA helicase HrpA [Desulfococcus multivorans]AOY58225.1 HrpA: ATP-dependent RNA helicase [Desulfococcus multivorans]AQV00571.1 ATP-dependent helicase [Desulfococcus multivorans]EPR42521.1 ATP-dependent helicase HrpA [Desulfococcus multivorans DSM 2059]SJZ96851.1 ATP-dependent helicase HrpA [Desulfococcus multivorans DSM 2059]
MKQNDIQNHINRLKSALSKTYGGDRHRFDRDLRQLRQAVVKGRHSKPGKTAPDKPDDRLMQRILQLESAVDASVRKRAQRLDRRPRLDYPEGLPILDRKDEIVATLMNHRVVVISGETGSGKTTQIPKFCIEAGRGIDGQIGMTQPRRIAAMTVADRIAEELGEPLGRSVGYKIRFDDQTGEDTFIKIMTDGILLAEAQSDRRLHAYDTLIVDEAHERSLNIDFVLGILKRLLEQRRELSLVITSATIDTEKFSRAFEGAPIIEVSGRMFPVEVRYMPPDTVSDESDQTHVDTAVAAVRKLQAESPYGGDILVFMPTEQDIRETCELLEGSRFTGVNILPLYGRLSAGEQSRVFQRLPGRKIIVATNVAETSITIPGIRFVVDTGLARISQYLPRSRTTALPVVPISRSSADQRMGRCGRVANGICIRLYSETDYENRPRFTPAEILRSNLAEVILRMISLRLGDVADFPFIDRPADKNIQDGFNLLYELGAIFRKRLGKSGRTVVQLTERGRVMARLPVDPRLSRMLLAAAEAGCLKEMTVLAAALSIQDPRERPTGKETQADQAHAPFKDASSDFITLLNIWNAYHETRSVVKSIGKMRAYCKRQFLSFRRMREWRDIHYQLAVILEEHGIRNRVSIDPDVADGTSFTPFYTALHTSILTGFLSNIAVRKDKFIYQAAREREAMIFPGSGVFKSSGPWVVAAEMVETSRLFARTVANIDVEWLEALGGDLCRRSYANPRWEKNRGEVVADEQVSLLGLIIVPRRPVSYGRIDPEAASRIFIRNALVEGDIRQPFPFIRHNQALIGEVRGIEDRVRRRDILVSEEDLCAFYADKLGTRIHDVRALKALLKGRKNDKFLRMQERDLRRYRPDPDELRRYPDQISLGNTVFPCDYVFDPSRTEDGVTVQIPSSVAPSVSPEALDWLVPGLLEEKITALIKGLPKEYRKQLVPVNATVRIIVNELPKGRGALLTGLAAFIYRRFGVSIPASAWNEGDLPEHLRMRIAIIGPGGEEIRSGRNVEVLRKSAADPMNRDQFEAVQREWERTGITRWDFRDLPESITLTGEGGETWVAYPGLRADKDGLSLKLYRDPVKAEAGHREGMVRLFSTCLANDLKLIRKQLALPKRLAESARYFGGLKSVENRIYDSVLMDLFHRNIRTRSAFDALITEATPLISRSAQNKQAVVVDILTAYHDCRSGLFHMENISRSNAGIIRFLSGLRDALANLVPENFLALYDTERLFHLKRYIRAISIRAQRAVENLERDQAKAALMKQHVDRLTDLLNSLERGASNEKRAAVETFFWMIEEYKVSLFAQELKTPIRISSKRLEEKYGEVRRMA